LLRVEAAPGIHVEEGDELGMQEIEVQPWVERF
jgi:hypothetical protein